MGTPEAVGQLAREGFGPFNFNAYTMGCAPANPSQYEARANARQFRVRAKGAAVMLSHQKSSH
jgi:hypothetical protein